MTHRERFLRTVRYKSVDRPASWLGLPTEESLSKLLSYFNVNSLYEVKQIFDDDVFPVWLPYHSPVSDKISDAFDFAGKGKVSRKEKTLTADGVFKYCNTLAEIEEFPWPDPEKYIDKEECKRVVRELPDDYARLGILWSAHFQDSCSAFGMETALIKMLTEPEIYQAIVDRILSFYLKANEIFYAAAGDHLDAVLLGNDFGGQSGLMVSPDLLRKFIFPGIRKLVDQAHHYGLIVIYHSCGSIRPIIPDLIELGVDVIHPIQSLAKGMEISGLRKDFYGLVSFCGGVDAQHLLVEGSPEEVRLEVLKIMELFPTGLVISPSHEAVLPDVKPANLDALFQTIKQVSNYSSLS